MSGFSGARIVNDGLILYLDAANADSIISGDTNWNDLSRYQRNGTITSGVTYNTNNNGSLDFNGSGSYWVVNSPFNLAALGYSAITYSFWVKSNTVATNQTFLANATQPGGSGYI